MKLSLSTGLVMLCCMLSSTLVFTQSALDQYEQGLIAERQGKVVMAKKFYTKAINMEQGNGAFYLSRANLIMNNQDEPLLVNRTDKTSTYANCLLDYNRAVLLLPDTYECHFGRAKVNYLLGNFDGAKNDYAEAVKLSYYFEDKIQALVGRGASQFKLGELEGALRDLERAENYDSTNIHVLNELALIYIHIDQPDIALNTLKKVLVNYPNDPTANANIGYAALKSGKYKEAMHIYNDYLKENGPEGLVYSNLGFCKYKLGRLTGALSDLEKAIDLDPENSFALKNRAIVHFALGNQDAGCSDLQEARDLGYSRKYDNEVINLMGKHCLQVNRKPSH